MKEAQKKYYQKNKTKIQEYRKARYHKNKEKMREYYQSYMA